MSPLRRARLASLVVVLVATGPGVALGSRDETRRAEADALLTDKNQWQQAIDSYRTLLEADPTWVEPRLQLARVLAWRGDYDESLAEYDQLAARPEPLPGLAVERAEVLSWAGRTQEAGAAFEALIEADPNDARAARGLARTSRWSGQRSRADRWYAHALAIEEDREARAELLAMRDELRTEVSGGARTFFDNADFSYYRTEARVARDLDFDTRVHASTATHFVRHDREPGAPFDGEPEDTFGVDARLGVERRLGPRWKALLEAGGRHWDHADAVPLATASLEFTPAANTSLAFELDYGDMLERSYSLESVLGDVRRGSGRASVWSQLTPALEGYAEVGGALLSSSNAEMFGGASVAWRPVERWNVHVALSVYGAHYEDPSELYYSPDLDLGAALAVKGRVPITDELAFTFDVGGGGGLSRETGATETGPAYRTKGGIAWRRGGFALDLDAARSQSVRASSYTTHEVALRASWSF